MLGGVQRRLGGVPQRAGVQASAGTAGGRERDRAIAVAVGERTRDSGEAEQSSLGQTSKESKKRSSSQGRVV